MLSIQEIKPSDRTLAVYIDKYVHISGDKLISKSLTPQIGTSLVFDLKHNALFKGLRFKMALIGLHENAFSLAATHPSTDRFLVQFSSFGLQAFVKIPVKEFNNQICEAEQIWGVECTELYHQLGETALLADRIRLLEAFLRAKMSPSSASDQLIFRVVTQIRQAPDSLSFDNLRASVPLSTRQVERKFKQLTGTNIGNFIRISRFSKAKTLLQQNPLWRLIDVGLEAGYYDQPHFIADFKALSGINPKRFRFC